MICYVKISEEKRIQAISRSAFRQPDWETVELPDGFDFSNLSDYFLVEGSLIFCPKNKEKPKLTESEVLSLLLKQQVNTLEVDDQTAFRMKAFYPAWAAGVSYAAGYKVQDSGKLWRCLQAHTAQDGWEPENTPALWEEICETHAGTLADPIPYEGNMALVAGLYYTQDGKAYLCTRDTGNPVYHALSELVGLYVEMV